MNSMEARNLLHASRNSVARLLLGHVATAINPTDIMLVHNAIEDEHKKQTITESEYEALTRLCNDIIIHKNAIPASAVLGYDSLTEDVSSTFNKRIWATSDMNAVIQFRNCVTDMFMLEMISVDEYITLNNTIDKYVENALSNGTK